MLVNIWCNNVVILFVGQTLTQPLHICPLHIPELFPSHMQVQHQRQKANAMQVALPVLEINKILWKVFPGETRICWQLDGHGSVQQKDMAGV